METTNQGTADGLQDLNRPITTAGGNREFLSLYKIETGLSDLANLRLEMREAGEDTAAVDEQIQVYLRKEISKVDGTADFILMLDRLCHEQRERKGSVERCQIDQEIDRLKARRDSLRGVLAHVKDAVKFVMEGMHWREGKPKKLEGVRHSITLRGNGGAQPVEITDESLVPDEYCRVTVNVNAAVWRDFLTVLSRAPGIDLAHIENLRKEPKREVSKSAVAEALQKPCGACEGIGTVTFVRDDGEYGQPEKHETCEVCGGTGKAGVPGCRLAERSSSVVVK